MTAQTEQGRNLQHGLDDLAYGVLARTAFPLAILARFQSVAVRAKSLEVFLDIIVVVPVNVIEVNLGRDNRDKPAARTVELHPARRAVLCALKVLEVSMAGLVSGPPTTCTPRPPAMP